MILEMIEYAGVGVAVARSPGRAPRCDPGRRGRVTVPGVKAVRLVESVA